MLTQSDLFKDGIFEVLSILDSLIFTDRNIKIVIDNEHFDKLLEEIKALPFKYSYNNEYIKHIQYMNFHIYKKDG